MDRKRNFASDNNAGMSPEALQGFIEANSGHCVAYGDDPHTEAAKSAIREWLEVDAEVFFVSGGTAGNCLNISASLSSYHSVICHEYAHIHNDECHAPGFFKPGVQLRLLKGDGGKLSADAFDDVIAASHGVHGTLPGMVSITQSTEAGTNYKLAEIKTIAEACHQRDMLLHMDGARFCNALVALGSTPAEMSWRAGVDLLTLGGVKNGLAFGEAIVVFKPEVVDRLDYRIKQSGQLASKMRYLSAPWKRYLRSGEWRKNAENANQMANYLADSLRNCSGVSLVFPVESNAVFFRAIDDHYPKMLEKGWQYYPFRQMDAYRLMCSWDTRTEDIDAWVEDLKTCL